MTQYLLTKNPTECCGCSACEQACTQHAIYLKPNAEGFLYPVLNDALCVECGICKKVCPYDNEVNGNEPIGVFATISTSEEILNKSSSGGMFRTLADHILENGGAVCGCIFDDAFRAVHKVSTEQDIVNKMQGSKYVQSDMGDTFKDVKARIEGGQTVLFTGTPCQTDGLKRFLQNDYDNLFTVDLVCHGVPSPFLLQEYLNQESKENGSITDLRFRNKERNGWCSQGSVTFHTKNKEKTKTITPFKDSYYNLYYLENCVSRLSCYSCPYANQKRVADITIGDYWNIDEKLAYNEIKKGVSLLLVNTEKGQELFCGIKDNIKAYETDLNHAQKGNSNIIKCADKPAKRDYIYKKILENGYKQAVKEECKFSYLVPFIRKCIPKGVKQAVKKILS